MPIAATAMTPRARRRAARRARAAWWRRASRRSNSTSTILRHPAKFDAANHTVNGAELRSMVERVAAVRDGDRARTSISASTFTRATTCRAPAASPGRWSRFNLLWLEEPIPAENVEALRQVRARSRTPICVGENLYLRWGFRELLQQQAADVIMPDVPKCGGLAESKKIANLAEIYYLPFAPHLVSTPLGTMATCPCLRGRSELPRSRMACARGARGLGQLCVRSRRLRLDRQGRAHRAARRARHRGRARHGRMCASTPCPASASSNRSDLAGAIEAEGSKGG